jgi:predicted metal-dependent hydrolase
MYPKAYIDYLVHFHGDRDYFECHEVLEEHWKEDERGNRKIYWVAFIQIAVSLYHQRRNNFNGSLKMMRNALAILKNEGVAVTKLGLDHQKLLSVLDKRMKEIKDEQPYTSIFLPIKDKNLINECEKECHLRGLKWWNYSNLEDHYLLNKHTLRNRDEVIQERFKQKELKNKNKRKE